MGQTNAGKFTARIGAVAIGALQTALGIDLNDVTAIPGLGPVLHPGMFFTIEPMVNAGRYDVKILPDGWTAVTRDKSLSAQFEHSIAVTEDGAEIFTLSPAGHTKPPYDLS